MEKKNGKGVKLNLYRKEQLVLCTILLCFAMSGFYLPTIKNEYAPPVEQTESNTEVSEIIEEVETQSELEEESVAPETDSETILENDSDKASENDSENDSEVLEPSLKPETEVEKPSKKPITPEKEPEEEPEKEQEKIWVPPVYEIVHHEAVYETVRVVACNYCSEEFGSVGEFQVHKDANGG